MGRLVLVLIAAHTACYASLLSTVATTSASCNDLGNVPRTVIDFSNSNPASALSDCRGTNGPSSSSTARAVADFGRLDVYGRIESGAQQQASLNSVAAFLENAIVLGTSDPLLAHFVITLDAVAGHDGSFGEAVGTFYFGGSAQGSLTETAFRFPPQSYRHVQQQEFEFGITAGQPFSFGGKLDATARGTYLVFVDANYSVDLSILDLNHNPVNVALSADTPEPGTGALLAGLCLVGLVRIAPRKLFQCRA